MGDLKPKPKKRKKRSPSKPKMRSALDVAKNPQPYQIPFYMPPFPALMGKQKERADKTDELKKEFTNFAATNRAELSRLRGDLTAFRQEQQTGFRQRVAYPRNTPNLGDPIAAEEPVAAEMMGAVVAEPVEAQPAQVKGADFLGEQQSLLSAQEDEERRKKAAEEFIAEPLTDVEEAKATAAAEEEKVISDVPPTTFVFGGAAEVPQVTPSPPSPAKAEESDVEEPPSPTILTQPFTGEQSGGGGGGMPPPPPREAKEGKGGFTRPQLLKLLEILARDNPTLKAEIDRIKDEDRRNVRRRGAVQTLAAEMGILGKGRTNIPMEEKDLINKIKTSGRIGRDIPVVEWNAASKGGENRMNRLREFAEFYDFDINY